SRRPPSWWRQRPGSPAVERDEMVPDTPGKVVEAKDSGDHDQGSVFGYPTLVAIITVAPTFPEQLASTLQYLGEAGPWIEVLRAEFGDKWDEPESIAPEEQSVL